MGACWAGCGACWAELAGPPPPKPSREKRWVWHGGLPMCSDDLAAGGLPSYVGMVKRDEVQLGSLTLQIETWPDYRIGSSVWPSGVLLAHALATGAAGLPAVCDLRVAELGAGPGLPGLVCGLLGALSVTLTDRTELVPLLDRNVELNGLSGACGAQALDWSWAHRSPLAAAGSSAVGPLDLLLAADVVYFEEQEPLLDAITALMAPGRTMLALAYRERTPMDRHYLNERILPRLDASRVDYEAPGHGSCEIYVGRLR
uniref:Calmodulin-lysine N-methyltransferase n=1 Tax=Pyrodinium bahamense TaxID=73915 RepID=A0A7S0B7M7_9DINO